jgi:hypothetical protein
LFSFFLVVDYGEIRIHCAVGLSFAVIAARGFPPGLGPCSPGSPVCWACAWAAAYIASPSFWLAWAAFPRLQWPDVGAWSVFWLL